MIYSPLASLGVYDFSSFRRIQSELYKKNILVLPCFIMAVNGGLRYAYILLHPLERHSLMSVCTTVSKS